MLVNNMSLKRMLDYQPSKEDMCFLPLEADKLLKVVLVGRNKNEVYSCISLLFNDAQLQNYFDEVLKTHIYDFDGTSFRDGKFICIFELFTKYEDEIIQNKFKELLKDIDYRVTLHLTSFNKDANESYQLVYQEGEIQIA